MASAQPADRPLEREITTYSVMRGDLERHHSGKFVVIQGEDLEGSFDTLDNAAAFARDHLSGQFLIREVGRETGRIPASVLYRRAEPV
jgi:hypothetical protein